MAISPDPAEFLEGAEASVEDSVTSEQTPPRRWGPRGTARASFAQTLTLEAISHAYDATLSLQDVSISIDAAETVCLLGPSGCGKTTLLRIIAGIDRPAAGRVVFDKREVAGPKHFVPPEKRGVGLMFQDFALFPHLSILDNVLFGLSGWPRDSALGEAMAALRRVGLEHLAGMYPHTLSGGEQQRVALARAIAPRPGVLLMDEPFSGLDSRLRDEVRNETLAVLRETRATSVIVTHDPEEAMRVADRIVLMRDGKVIQVGTAEDLYHHPVDLAAARFFSEINEISGHVDRGWLATPLGRFPASGMAANMPAIACIRPQSIRLVRFGEAIAGRVIRRRFLGEVDLVEIAVAELDTPVFARVRHSAPHIGQDVGICIDPADVMVFADERDPS